MKQKTTSEQGKLNHSYPYSFPTIPKNPLVCVETTDGRVFSCLGFSLTKNKIKQITKSLGIKKLSELTGREKEAIRELSVASVGCAALAVSWRNAEVGPHTVGQMLWDT